jgi:hypothetical protein
MELYRTNHFTNYNIAYYDFTFAMDEFNYEDTTKPTSYKPEPYTGCPCPCPYPPIPMGFGWA